MRKYGIILIAVILLGYISNIVSGQMLIKSMGIKYMGAAISRKPALAKQFYDSAHRHYWCPFYVKVFVYVKQNDYLYTDKQSGIFLFGWNIVKFDDKNIVTK